MNAALIPRAWTNWKRPERGLQFPVDAILDAAGVCGMLNVADIGAGSGYFTLPHGATRVSGKGVCGRSFDRVAGGASRQAGG